MIKIVHRTSTAYPCGDYCEILADTESEILALGEVVKDDCQSVKVDAGSIAYTAGYGVIYQLSPSKVWTKV